MPNFYGRGWDHYIRTIFPRDNSDPSVRPGDEWGAPPSWDHVYARLLDSSGAAGWSRVVEIGPGAGKYTRLLIERSAAQVLAADVSPAFLDELSTREADTISAGRLFPVLLQGESADELLAAVEARGWAGSVDAVFSIDSMVHVDLQHLAAYFLIAAVSLRPGGKLCMTLADPTTERGMKKLLDDVALYHPLQGEPSLKFEYVDALIVRAVLERLGFNIDVLDHDDRGPAGGRDLFVVATLADVATGRASIKWLRPTLTP